jgi:hypothetical protein
VELSAFFGVALFYVAGITLLILLASGRLALAAGRLGNPVLMMPAAQVFMTSAVAILFVMVVSVAGVDANAAIPVVQVGFLLALIMPIVITFWMTAGNRLSWRSVAVACIGLVTAALVGFANMTLLAMTGCAFIRDAVCL